MEDKDIIALFLQRSGDAVTETDKKYGLYCRAIAENICRDSRDAEECVNDAYLAAWNSIPPQKPSSLKLFLARIVRNLAINRYNETHAEKRGGGETALVLDELAECLQSGESVEGELDRRQLGELIRGFVKALPKKERQIFVRRYFFTDPVKSIAQRYGMTENNVLVTLCRSRKKLKELLKKEGFYNG